MPDDTIVGAGGDVRQPAKFATKPSAPERLPETTGDLCVLCLEPLTSSGAARLARFNDFVSGEATKRADAACKALQALLAQVEQVKVPEVVVVEKSLAAYGQLDATRAEIVAEIIRILREFETRRASLLDETANPAPAPDVAALIATSSAELKDRAKLANDL